MKTGYLSEFFSGIALKTLSAVEADLVRSHQHEFNGVEGLKKLFGRAVGKQKFTAKFIYLTDDDSETVISEGFLTWYDARETHPTRSEYRLYFPTTAVSNCATQGDLLVIGRHQNGSILVIVAKAESTISNQIRWLFGFPSLNLPAFSVRAETQADQIKLEFASRFILREIGIVQEEAPDFLDLMLDKFGQQFPSTRQFSEFARSTMSNLDPRDDPDAALLEWMNREEILFRTLERHIVADRLLQGFANDVDGFLSYSLSVQNRRKSRVGSALENHVEEIFLKCNIRYDRTKITENRSKPDFILPGITEYKDPSFPATRLTMLGVKSTCKDRWRQVLAEADRIKNKHLLTLEPAISTTQTDEMKNKHLSLIIPKGLHSSYTTTQQNWLMTFSNFINEVKKQQNAT